MKKYIITIIIALAASVILAGCGGPTGPSPITATVTGTVVDFGTMPNFKGLLSA